MPFPKPGSLPRWADVGGGAGIAVPASGALDTGWFIKQKMPAQWLNWLFNLIYQWCAYLFDFENNARTWNATQTFAGNAMQFSGIQQWTANSPWLEIDNTGPGFQNARQAIYMNGSNNTAPVVSAAGGVLSIINNAVGACLRASGSGTGAQTAWLNNTGDSSYTLRLFENAGDGHGTALDIILNSVNGTALQAVGSSGGAYFALFDNSGGSAPALKVNNTGGGHALEIGEGHAQLTGTVIAPTVAQLNMLSPGLIVKAWCLVETNGANAVTLRAGQNVSAVALVASSLGPAHDLLAVTFAQDFANDHVCLLGTAGGVASVTSGRYVIQPWQSGSVGGDTNRHHQMGVGVEDLNAAGTLIDLGATAGVRVMVAFLGVQ